MEIKDKKLFERHKSIYYTNWGAPWATQKLKSLWKNDFKKLYGTDDVKKLFGEHFIYGNDASIHDLENQ